MGGFEQIDEAILAGARIEDEDIGAAAAISPLKFSKDIFAVPLWLGGSLLSGTNVVKTYNGKFPSITLPNANTGSIFIMANTPKSEIVPGEYANLTIAWTATASAGAGNVRFEVYLRPIIEGNTSRYSVITANIVSPKLYGTGLVETAVLPIPPSLISNNQLIGIEIRRVPSNVLDTLAVDVWVVCAYLSINGRC